MPLRDKIGLKLTGLFLLFFVSLTGFAGVLSTIWGKPTPSRALFEPYGYHIFCDDFSLCTSNDPQPNNAQFLTQLTWKGYALGTFKNSFSNQVGYAAVDRQLVSTRYFGLSYLLGFMVGYHQEDGSIGQHFNGLPAPLIALDGQLKVTKRFSLDISYYGVGALFGGSLFF